MKAITIKHLTFLSISFFVDSHCSADKVLDYSNRNITDDEISASLIPPRPISVSQICKEIGDKIEKYSKDPKRSHKSSTLSVKINLRDNTICDNGALFISTYFENNPFVESIDLSSNHITDRGVKYLEPLLLKDNIKEIDITSNYGANLASLQKIRDEIRHKLRIDNFDDSES
ncbi:MAG: hypothetical protein K2X02_05835 [Alphaproteobacteria bacterium]|nr:hypothetical protein [Alphaproteobacteria bacterium]